MAKEGNVSCCMCESTVMPYDVLGKRVVAGVFVFPCFRVAWACGERRDGTPNAACLPRGSRSPCAGTILLSKRVITSTVLQVFAVH